MDQNLKITAICLLFIQAFQITLLQDTTVSTGRTIDKSWLREPFISAAASKNATDSENTGENADPDGAGMESSDDNLILNGSVFSSSGDDSDMVNQDQNSNVTVTSTTMLSTFPNATTKEPKWPETTTNSTKLNDTRTKDEFQNSTTDAKNATTPPITQSTTSIPDLTNHTGLEKTTLLPKTNVTQKSTPAPGIWVSNGTEANNVTTTKVPETNGTSTTPSSTTELSSETTVDKVIPVDLTTIHAGTPEKVNLTDKDAASGGNTERGLATDHKNNRRNKEWGAILGTAVAVCVVGLVVYVILKKRNQRGFSHRKLVEFSPDPVLRLDNSEPLDLNYGGSSYYNGGLQSDIQMTNFPGRD